MKTVLLQLETLTSEFEANFWNKQTKKGGTNYFNRSIIREHKCAISFASVYYVMNETFKNSI